MNQNKELLIKIYELIGERLDKSRGIGNQNRTGKTLTEEQKQKMSESRKGKKRGQYKKKEAI